MSAIENSLRTDPQASVWLPNELGAGDAMPEMLRALFVGYPDMVIVTGARGRIVSANPSAVAGFGDSREQLEGQSPSQRSHQWPRRNP
jgi:PAS domain S-box-containing protein